MAKRPEVFILDVDGVMTSGAFFYSSEGKVMKAFGPDDNDGLCLLKSHIKILFVTGDEKGFPISKKRIVDDMGFQLEVVSTVRRIEWIAERYPLDSVIYMGDGIFDYIVMAKVGYSIAPANSDRNTKSYASFITERAGGDRAVAEACIHILKKFFRPFDPDQPPSRP
jgi:3-deoxy-D-manno-octulosonate 8-phosphate phosphatase (KDO 8-P phosphatase)